MAARAWCDDDPDPETAQQLDAVIAAAASGDVPAENELSYAFSGRLQFGTAGLRAAMGWGPRRMNRATVSRAAAGLGTWLLAEMPVVVGMGASIPTTSGVSRGAKPRVVVGYDARHKSDVFARDTVEILAGLGIDAQLLPRPLPTPVLAFALGALEATAGVMVTASHNPAADNGYKVYVGRQQIAPPQDEQIAARIDGVASVRDLPRSDAWTLLDDDVVARYVDRAVSLVDPGSPRELRIVYTPLHGVAGELLLQVLQRADFPRPIVVPEQYAPDPDFPTLSSPNPEHPQTLELAIATAVASDADLIIATDPDGDRCAVVVADSTDDGRWRQLTGDEVGDLLGELLADDGVPGAFATTVVSSARLAAIAAAHGRDFARTLTGFKWLATVPELRYAYEEAIGYCVDPDAVRDKDGLTAALRILELAASLRARGRTLTDALAELDSLYGRDLTEQVVVSTDDSGLRQIEERLAQLRAAPPDTFGGLGLIGVDDLRHGVDGLPGTPGLRLRLQPPCPGGSARVLIRPSGTEPITKAYLEVTEPPGGSHLLSTQQNRTNEDQLASDPHHTEDSANAALNRLREEVSDLLR